MNLGNMFLEQKITLFLLLFSTACNASSAIGKLNAIQQNYVSNFLSGAGNSTVVFVKDLKSIFEGKSVTWAIDNTYTKSQCFMTTNALNISCLVNSCLPYSDLVHLTRLTDHPGSEDLPFLTTTINQLIVNADCGSDTMIPKGLHMPPSHLEVWGYGILCTTLINLCALGGLVALPFIHGQLYKKILIYMVGLAVGTLAGSSILFLIPEALELTEEELDWDSYVWKCLTVIFGIYTFFIIERLLKLIIERKEARSYTKMQKKKSELEPDSAMHFSSFHNTRPIPAYKNVDDLPHISPCGNNESSNSSISDDIDMQTEESSMKYKDTSEPNSAQTGPLVPSESHVNHHGHHHHSKHVEPVAWMIIFGDGLHNFIDGVSIGAAFTESILAGVSVSVAILCEELPHELGDFAVLLNAGMKLKKAVLYNFLSATMCYIGLVVGIVLGENTATHSWVFAFAGGMFLYISLVDMMPEMNSAGEQEDNQHLIGKHLIFLLQNIGLLMGFGLMLLMAVYGGNIENLIRGTS